MASAGFLERSGKRAIAVQQVKELKGWIEPYDRLAGRITAALELDELLAGEPDQSMSAEVDQEVGRGRERHRCIRGSIAASRTRRLP